MKNIKLKFKFRNKSIKLFFKITSRKFITKTATTCGVRQHRINDLPSKFSDNIRSWRINGFIERENNLPTIIYSNGEVKK